MAPQTEMVFPKHKSPADLREQRRARELKEARRTFVSSVVSVQPSPQVLERDHRAAEMVRRAKRAEFLDKYRATAKGHSDD